ncbi:MAG: dihydropteroate synthase [Lentisphaeraceae bacterium]|nr:dihydropteroate synthase [Lentisphaeraceae bacterium]
MSSRTLCNFKTARKTITLGKETLIMAVLNCTPDSFSDGGSHEDTTAMVNHALEMIDQGAGLIDIGGESTRPGAKAVSEEEELSRVIPVIEALRKKSDILISIDTTKSNVARQAIEAGADIINDISAFKIDPKMKDVALETGAGCMLMHMRGTPQTMQQFLEYDDLIEDILTYFKETIKELTDFGIDEKCLMIDPGIGFSKNVDQNLQIIKELNLFSELNLPILLGTSRKSFIGHVLNKTNPQDRVWGTAASIAIGISNGAHAVRVHDITEMTDVAKLCDVLI